MKPSVTAGAALVYPLPDQNKIEDKREKKEKHHKKVKFKNVIKIGKEKLFVPINADLLDSASTTLLSKHGDLVQTLNKTSGGFEMETSSLSAGVYILRIETSEGVQTEKVIFLK